MTSEMHKLYHIFRSNSSKERWTHLPTLHFEARICDYLLIGNKKSLVYCESSHLWWKGSWCV